MTKTSAGASTKQEVLTPAARGRPVNDPPRSSSVTAAGQIGTVFAVLARPESVRAARDVVRGALTGWGWAGPVDTALLCLSELLTNAVAAAEVGSPLVVRAWCAGTGSYLHLDVMDADTTHIPQATVPVETTTAHPQWSHLKEHGRGLLLVSELSSRWGVEMLRGGKRVWVEIADAHLDAAAAG